MEVGKGLSIQICLPPSYVEGGGNGEIVVLPVFFLVGELFECFPTTITLQGFLQASS